MKPPSDRQSTIDSAHKSDKLKPPHNREQLRRRLLKMILQNESQRRSTMFSSRSSSNAVDKAPIKSSTKLAVYDPEDFIGKEQATGDISQKPA